ncbi:hypothetical protein PBRA_004240 [Plasmodiophora brassicae]|uniref:DUF2723 domain-containing protein n=1 Tax=Plasmodiophora brassicae TaxID=37360 RepID=A0A0G4IK06_PLABS|nr:hypothetical protein PBRA_004240 [Plasmodiophora brassicae]
MPRRIPGGDSGELAACACVWTVPHPPGYPLFTMLYGTWLWGLQSVMSLPDAPAVLMSSLSCALSIGAAHFLFDALAPALVDPWTGALLATAFALSPAVWEYGMQVEVFALHNFLLSMLVWFTMRCLRTPYRLRDVLSAAFVCGLAMSNQHTSIVFIVPVAASVVVYHSLWRRLPLIILCFVAGVAPYAFLPLSTPSARSWGRHDTLAGFLAHVLRSTYGSAKMVQDQNSTDIRKNLSETVPVFLDHLSDTRGMFLVAVLAAVGMVAVLSNRLPRDMRIASRVLLASLFVYLLCFLSLANIPLSSAPLNVGVIARFWQQADLLLFFFAAIGIRHAFTDRLQVPVAAAIVALLFASSVSDRYYSATEGIVDTFGRSILESLPASSIVFLGGDLNIAVLRYLQDCEHVRPDVAVVHLPFISQPWFRPDLMNTFVKFPPGRRYGADPSSEYPIGSLIDLNIERANGRLFLCGSFSKGDTSYKERYKLLPWGICFRIVTHSFPTSLSFYHKARAALPALPAFDPAIHAPSTWEHVVYKDAFSARLGLFQYIIAEPGLLDDSALLKVARDVANEIAELRLTVGKGRVLSANILYNAGVVCARWAAEHRDDATANQQMIQFWQAYVQRDQDADRAIVDVVQSRTNPFSGQVIP